MEEMAPSCRIELGSKLIQVNAASGYGGGWLKTDRKQSPLSLVDVHPIVGNLLDPREHHMQQEAAPKLRAWQAHQALASGWSARTVKAASCGVSATRTTPCAQSLFSIFQWPFGVAPMIIEIVLEGPAVSKTDGILGKSLLLHKAMTIFLHR